jgi:hypothetical protein
VDKTAMQEMAAKRRMDILMGFSSCEHIAVHATTYAFDGRAKTLFKSKLLDRFTGVQYTPAAMLIFQAIMGSNFSRALFNSSE